MLTHAPKEGTFAPACVSADRRAQLRRGLVPEHVLVLPCRTLDGLFDHAPHPDGARGHYAMWASPRSDVALLYLPSDDEWVTVEGMDLRLAESPTRAALSGRHCACATPTAIPSVSSTPPLSTDCNGRGDGT